MTVRVVVTVIAIMAVAVGVVLGVDVCMGVRVRMMLSMRMSMMLHMGMRMIMGWRVTVRMGELMDCMRVVRMEVRAGMGVVELMVVIVIRVGAFARWWIMHDSFPVLFALHLARVWIL